MKYISYNSIYLAVKIILSFIFLWSGINKLSDPEAFSVTIDAFGIAPEALIDPLTYFIPVLEILLSVFLIFEVRGSLGAVTCLMIFFILLLSYGIHLGLDIDCGCFGPEDPEKRAFSGLRTALYRDIVIMFGIFFMYFYRIKLRKCNNQN